MADGWTWLGHRDLCEIQWGLPCTCRCTAPDCPGVDRCQVPVCPVLELFNTTD
jgi:hypothetical protein